MSETADALTVRCEVPGVAREDIETSIEGGVLTIRGTRKTPEDRLEERYHGRGRFVGPFERTLELPARVDVDNVKAKLTDGVLEITMPKHPDSRPKRIEVKLG
jgi:HSP20 family protein